MKKMKAITFSLIIVVLLLSNCKKDNTDYPTYFYMKVPSNDGKFALYINNTYKGDLPNLNISAINFNDSLKLKAILIYLKAGKYKIEAKDIEGNTKSRATYKFTSNKISMSGMMGGLESSGKQDTTVIGLFY